MFAHFKHKLKVSHIWTQTQLMLGVNTVHKTRSTADANHREHSRFSFHSESNI